MQRSPRCSDSPAVAGLPMPVQGPRETSLPRSHLAPGAPQESSGASTQQPFPCLHRQTPRSRCQSYPGGPWSGDRPAHPGKATAVCQERPCHSNLLSSLRIRDSFIRWFASRVQSEIYKQAAWLPADTPARAPRHLTAPAHSPCAQMTPGKPWARGDARNKRKSPGAASPPAVLVRGMASPGPGLGPRLRDAMGRREVGLHMSPMQGEGPRPPPGKVRAPQTGCLVRDLTDRAGRPPQAHVGPAGAGTGPALGPHGDPERHLAGGAGSVQQPRAPASLPDIDERGADVADLHRDGGARPQEDHLRVPASLLCGQTQGRSAHLRVRGGPASPQEGWGPPPGEGSKDAPGPASLQLLGVADAAKGTFLTLGRRPGDGRGGWGV